MNRPCKNIELAWRNHLDVVYFNRDIAQPTDLDVPEV